MRRASEKIKVRRCVTKFDHAPGFKPGVVDQMPGVVDQMPGVVDQMPGVVDQMPGVVDQMPGRLVLKWKLGTGTLFRLGLGLGFGSNLLMRK